MSGPDDDEAPPDIAESDEVRLHRPGRAVKFTGGRYNGFTGTIRLMGESCAAIVILYDHKPCEVVEEIRFLTPLRSFPPPIA